eukprot:239586-Amphidinium_carterae.1
MQLTQPYCKLPTLAYMTTPWSWQRGNVRATTHHCRKSSATLGGHEAVGTGFSEGLGLRLESPSRCCHAVSEHKLATKLGTSLFPP